MRFASYFKVTLPSAIFGFLALGLAPTSAFATTQTTTMGVGASVTAVCSISASALSFGSYTGTLLDGSTTLSVTCTDDAPYTIGLDAGTGTGATVTARTMTGANHHGTLNYALFTDSGYTLNWDNIGGSNVYSGTGSGTAQTVTVYAQIAATQNVPVDTYSDTITATVSY
jgi:spore coat protein U-like protein